MDGLRAADDPNVFHLFHSHLQQHVTGMWACMFVWVGSLYWSLLISYLTALGHCVWGTCKLLLPSNVAAFCEDVVTGNGCQVLVDFSFCTCIEVHYVNYQ